jgi:hypothetical protein
MPKHEVWRELTYELWKQTCQYVQHRQYKCQLHASVTLNLGARYPTNEYDRMSIADGLHAVSKPEIPACAVRSPARTRSPISPKHDWSYSECKSATWTIKKIRQDAPLKKYRMTEPELAKLLYCLITVATISKGR